MSNTSRRDAVRKITAGAMAALLPSGASGKATPPKIKIGQIGVGHGHATKLEVYRASLDYEVVGIVEPNEALRKRVENHPAYRGLSWLSREQLLNIPGLQAVLVETRVEDLLDNADACVAAGMHVHVDKPAGDSLARLEKLLQDANRKKLLVQMGYMYRYNPGVLLLREFLRKGWLGDIFEIHAVMGKVVAPAERKALARFPGGIFFELGCHLIDLVVGLAGKPNKVTPFVQKFGGVDDGLHDNMLAVLSYPRALATVKSSAMEVDGFARRHLVVCGTEGTFHLQPLDDPVARVSFSRARGEYRPGYQDIRFPRFVRYVADAADMAKIIRGEKAADYSSEHDLTVQSVLLGACGMEAGVKPSRTGSAG